MSAYFCSVDGLEDEKVIRESQERQCEESESETTARTRRLPGWFRETGASIQKHKLSG